MGCPFNRVFWVLETNNIADLFEDMPINIAFRVFINSDGKTVYTRYVGEQHVKEDCFNHIPSAKEWVNSLDQKEKPIWMIRTMEINIED